MSTFKLYNGRKQVRVFRMIAIAAMAAPLCAPADMPKGLFHGQMVSWEGSITKGVLLARTAAGIIEGCGYDALSILQLSRQRITVAKLEAGRSHRDHHRPQTRFAGLLHPHAGRGSSAASSHPRETCCRRAPDLRFASRRQDDFRHHHPARCPVDHSSVHTTGSRPCCCGRIRAISATAHSRTLRARW